MKSRFDRRGPAGPSATECLPLVVDTEVRITVRTDEPGDPPAVLRPATPEDHCFAESLYIANMAHLFRELGAWDEEAAVNRLRASFASTEIWLIEVDGQDVGWLQVCDKIESLELRQIHLVKSARGGGIGTCIMRYLMARAQAEQKRISLAVLPNNRARNLYQKLGFVFVGAEGVKLLMQWPDHGGAVRS